MKILQIVSGIIRRDTDVLLIQQASSNEQAFWSLPGGVVESGEMLYDALKREIAEETGLTAHKIGRLAYITQTQHEDYQSIAYVFEVDTWDGELAPNDPDDLILQASFLPIGLAKKCLEDAVWRPMIEPVIAYLDGAPIGNTWFYHQHDFTTFERLNN